jgi:outer membrane protein insertion porin family
MFLCDMMNFRRSLLSAACVLALSAGVPAYATSTDGDMIRDVRVEGNERVEGRTILSYLGLNLGSRFNQDDIDAGLKNLFATGFFSDVKLLRDGTTLVVRVSENPVINKVVFEGNDRIDTEDLEKEVELKPRSVLSQDKVQGDVKRILDIYRRSGRYNATVEPKVIKLDQNRVDLAYEINEGPVARVKKISFIGNEEFSSRELREVVRTEETGWYKFLTDNDKYDSDRLQFDQELLRRFYINEGYVDFQVKSAHAELSPKKDAFYVTFAVEEGPQYTFGEIKVESELKEGRQPDFSGVITTKAGKTYDASEVEETIDGMTKALGDQGYAFVDIQPKLDRDRAKKTAGITYVIKPGPRVYVERINIHGNVRTLDEVVRREFRLNEGDPYNTSKMQRSEQRINNLGFFEKAEVKTEPGSAPDKTVVDVTVQEKSTGEINLGAGYSTTNGVLGDIGIKERNLLGRGQELKARFTLAARLKQAELGFTEPYFLNRELATGFDLYRSQQELQRESSYDSDIRGFNLRSSYALQEKWQHSLRYTLRSTDITDIQPGASQFIVGQAGSNITSALGHSVSYDDRDNKMNPTKGYYLNIGQEVAGLAGDDKYLKHEIKTSYYYSIAPQWVISALGSGGYIFGLGSKDIRINNRFFVGGDDFRGFRSSGIGPRDTSTRDSLGGNAYYIGTTELRFPLGLPEEVGLSGALFADAGSLWQTDDSGAQVFDESSPRVSVGAGLLWTSPFGPIRVDLGYPLVKETADLTENLRFSFGTRF